MGRGDTMFFVFAVATNNAHVFSSTLGLAVLPIDIRCQVSDVQYTVRILAACMLTGVFIGTR